MDTSIKSIQDVRHYVVTKSNDLIQKSRFSLTTQQQKIVLYLISKIMPYDDDFKLYDFSIPDFCKICGIDYKNGKNYIDLKTTIQELTDKSLWVTLENGVETVVRWIEKPYIDPGSGVISIRLDKDMKPYLLQLKENFTSYELLYTLQFQSKYTIRIYELIKSVHFHELEDYCHVFSLDELKLRCDGEVYKEYRDFKRRVLLKAVNEINKYSDKTISIREIKRGRFVVAVEFQIRSKRGDERWQVEHMVEKILGTTEPTLWEQVQQLDERAASSQPN